MHLRSYLCCKNMVQAGHSISSAFRYNFLQSMNSTECSELVSITFRKLPHPYLQQKQQEFTCGNLQMTNSVRGWKDWQSVKKERVTTVFTLISTCTMICTLFTDTNSIAAIFNQSWIRSNQVILALGVKID